MRLHAPLFLCVVALAGCDSPPAQPTCTGAASVTPIDFRECNRGGFDRTVSVNATGGCAWTAASTSSWLTVSSGSSGAGTGAITFTFADNYDAAREGVIEVRWPAPAIGQNVRVHQEGCLYMTTRDDFDVPVSGGDFAVDVYASPTDPACGGPLQDVCVWSAVSSAPWVTVLTTMPRHGDDRVSFRVAANGTGSARAATITVRGRTVAIRQGG